MRQFVKNNRPYAQTSREDFAQKYLAEGCLEVPVLYEENFIDPTWNGTTFIEGATPEEIAEANKPKVPCSISRMRLKLELFERNITVEDIVDTIASIPSAVFSEAEKQKALIKFQEATSYDRYNADLNLIATLMGLSQEDLDEIFINGNQ